MIRNGRGKVLREESRMISILKKAKFQFRYSLVLTIGIIIYFWYMINSAIKNTGLYLSCYNMVKEVKVLGANSSSLLLFMWLLVISAGVCAYRFILHTVISYIIFKKLKSFEEINK